MYLLTNENVELTGAYEMVPEVVAFDLGLEVEQVKQSMERFMQDKKICFVDNFIVLLNHLKYQDYSKGSENQKKAFERELCLLPAKIQQIVQNKGLTGEPQLVGNQLATSSQLVGNYTEIRNKKTEIRNKKEGGVGETKKIEVASVQGEVVTEVKETQVRTFKQFTDQEVEILEKARELYPDKNVEKAIVDFKDWCMTSKKANDTKDYKLRFFRWVREDKFNQYSLVQVGLGYNGRPKLVIT